MKNLIGKKLKEFKVQAYHKGQFREVTEESIKGKWSVFFFYPADFTFVCPTELADLQEHYEEFQNLNVEIYSVSTDSHFVHKAWADASQTIGRLEFPMLSDATGVLSKFFGVRIKESGQALRGTFLLNPDGEVKAYEIHDLGIGRDAEELLRKIQAAQFVAANGDQVCPAKWRPGEETLTPSLDLIGKI